MYAVVGCDRCDALWVVADEPETTGCPRCEKRHRYRPLTKFFEGEDETAARQARAALLAERQGHGDAFADLDDVAEMEAHLDDAGVGDDEYLAGSGLDPEAVAAAGADEGGGSGSRVDTVRAALEELEEPSADAVVAYASERGVPADAARETLDRLVRAGDATERDGTYRPL